MTSNGRSPILYALGSNGSGQLGIGHDQDVSIPRQVLFSPPDAAPASPITRIAAGGNHTLLLAADGTLYRAGDASAGACGPSSADEDPVATPNVARRVASLGDDASVQLAAATWEASIIVQRRQAQDDHDNAAVVVSTFGAGAKGELGLGQFIIRTPSISRVSSSSSSSFPPAGASVVDLAASMGHVVSVLSDGTAWGWGSGRKGQLGAADTAAAADGVVHEPRRIEGVGFPVARAVCGREFTVLFGRPDGGGEVLVLGADKAGVRSSAPARVVGWRDVGASWGGVYVLRGDGTLLSWGKDDHGQLAPPGLPRLAKMAVGSEHVVALTEDGDVLSWGWGEHGNCGPQVENGDVKGRWNTIASKKYIPPGSDIVAIGAGCATSWISLEMASEP